MSDKVKSNGTFAELIGKGTIIAISIVSSTVVFGYTLMKLWTWFIVYAFGVKPLTLIEAIGLSFTLAFVKIYRSKHNDKDESLTKEAAKSIVFCIIISAMFLFFGWIITLFH